MDKKLNWVGAIVIAGWVAGCASTAQPPTEQIAVSKASVTRAASVGGNEYAPEHMKSASKKITAAEKAMADEEYAKAKRLAEQAEVDAKLAETKADLAKAEIAIKNAEESNRALREEIDRGAE